MTGHDWEGLRVICTGIFHLPEEKYTEAFQLLFPDYEETIGEKLEEGTKRAMMAAYIRGGKNCMEELKAMIRKGAIPLEDSPGDTLRTRI